MIWKCVGSVYGSALGVVPLTSAITRISCTLLAIWSHFNHTSIALELHFWQHQANSAPRYRSSRSAGLSPLILQDISVL